MKITYILFKKQLNTIAYGNPISYVIQNISSNFAIWNTSLFFNTTKFLILFPLSCYNSLQHNLISFSFIFNEKLFFCLRILYLFNYRLNTQHFFFVKYFFFFGNSKFVLKHKNSHFTRIPKIIHFIFQLAA